MSSRGHFVENRSTNREASIAMLHDLTSAEGAICKPDISDVGAVFTQRIPRTLPVIAVVQRVRLYNQVEMCQLPHKINDVDNSLPVIVRELLWSRQRGVLKRMRKYADRPILGVNTAALKEGLARNW